MLFDQLAPEEEHKHQDKGGRAASKAAVEDLLAMVIAGANVVRTACRAGDQEVSVRASLRIFF
jgi:hypothetical protein